MSQKKIIKKCLICNKEFWVFSSCNERKFCSRKCYYYYKLGKDFKTPEEKKRISESHLGEQNPQWKGDRVSYRSLHEWINNQIPKPEKCEVCLIKPPFDCANISGEYKRDLTDWMWICRRCHMKLDGRLEKLHIRNSAVKIIEKN